MPRKRARAGPSRCFRRRSSGRWSCRRCRLVLRTVWVVTLSREVADDSRGGSSPASVPSAGVAIADRGVPTWVAVPRSACAWPLGHASRAPHPRRRGHSKRVRTSGPVCISRTAHAEREGSQCSSESYPTALSLRLGQRASRGRRALTRPAGGWPLRGRWRRDDRNPAHLDAPSTTKPSPAARRSSLQGACPQPTGRLNRSCRLWTCRISE